MLKHPKLFISLAILTLCVAIFIILREISYERRRQERDEEDLPQPSSNGLSDWLAVHPEAKLDDPAVREVAAKELRALEKWLASHPDEEPRFRKYAEQLKRVIALSKPSS